MKLAVIMRGLPGSGKSTRARLIAGRNGIICAADDFFLEEDGETNFSGPMVPEAHAGNVLAFQCALMLGVEIVVCDNTNIKHEEYEPYVRMAEEAGYKVAIIAMPHPSPEEMAERNTHGVPGCTLNKMFSRWED